MKRNPWVQARRMSNEEIDAEIQKFKDNGGEVIVIDDTFNTTKTNSDTAVKIGKVHRQLAATRTKKND